MIKTGFSVDIHKLEEGGDSIVLGGIIIPTCNFHVVAHSDGDVLFHSLSNAILSALGLEDIGYYFDDRDSQNKGINSQKILDFALNQAKERGYKLNNVSILINLERPRLSDFKGLMKDKLMKLLNLDFDSVSVMATTNEGLDSIGNGAAIRVYSNVLIERVEK